ncbi:hypothetical protein K7X08_006861 [Anisodus acutangulus]|uniref:Uncharacterized protein n=1 Tax=Anisodus acutangulus TaxID=402998 RepID=A0A9Q1QXQ8_9SOLA|nr:hypothetical protein K7X08_006861 [Anisodus acutangulus]
MTQSRFHRVEEQDVQIALQKSLFDNYPTSVPSEAVCASSSSAPAGVILALPLPLSVPEQAVVDVEIDTSEATEPRDKQGTLVNSLKKYPTLNGREQSRVGKAMNMRSEWEG